MSDTNTPILIRLPEALLRAVEDWRFANRSPTRADAVRRLIERGLADAKTPTKKEPRK
jgi:metal-responsive CopG/Arc/MetJ family transcriptional regulator